MIVGHYIGRLADDGQILTRSFAAWVSPHMCVVNVSKTICFGHTAERAISTFVFIVEITMFVGRFWHIAEAAQEIEGI
jgi:hypothetical protein